MDISPLFSRNVFLFFLTLLITIPLSVKADTRVHGTVLANLERETIISNNQDFQKILNKKLLKQKDLQRLSDALKELNIPPISIQPSARLDTVRKTVASLPSRSRFLSRNILLPDIKLSLKPSGSNTILAKTTSNLHGVFDLPEVPKGRYQLCWGGKGWKSDCQKKLITASGTGPYYVPPIHILPETRQGYRVLAGRVLLADNTPCRVFNWKQNIDFTAQVQSKKTPSQKVRANSQGYYVLPQVESGVDEIKTSCDDTNVDKIFKALENKSNSNIAIDKANIEAVLTSPALTANTSINGAGDRVVNIVLKNNRPSIIDLSFISEFGDVGRAPAGSKVITKANILDEDKLALFWTLPTEKATVEGNQVTWIAPKRLGLYRLSLFAGDGRGGWNSISKSFEVTEDPRLPFAGTVTIDGKAITKKSRVLVSVNGKKLKLNPKGYFSGKIKPVKENRYVMNIEALGKLPISRIFHRESTGGQYNLISARTVTIDPKNPRPINIGVKSKEESFIKLSPNSLVLEGTDKLATGPVMVTSRYLDPSRDTLPGDYDAIDPEGRNQSLISFGAAYLDFRDNQGRKLNLQKGKTAKLVMQPAPKSIGSLSLLPATLPIWTYNTQTGFWDLEKVSAKLVNGSYRAPIPHFSTVNLDLGTLGNSACVRIQLDFIRTPQNRILKVLTDNGIGGTQIKQVTLDQRLNAVFRLLPLSTTTFSMTYADGTPFTNFQLREVASNGSISSVVNNTITLQAGDEQQSPVDLWPNQPFTDCQRLLIASGNVPGDKVQPPSNLSPDFFTEKSAETINQGRAKAYYAFMDQNNERLNLEGWLVKNGFQPIASGAGFTFPPAAGVVELSYLNHGDLGSGRKMQCRKDNDRVACIVGNYSANADAIFNRDPASADTAHAAIMGTGFATVGMEYSVVDGTNSNEKVVKFFTYRDNINNNRPRILAAALEEDANQNRNLPELCQVCHGGTIPNTFPTDIAGVDALDITETNAIIDHFANSDPSSFREFDLNALRNLQGSQPERKTKQLNCDYVLASNPISGVGDLIRGWYGNDCDTKSNTGINQPTFVPAAWQSTPEDINIYTDVVANVCRTCHIAQKNLDFTDPSSGSNPWNTANSPPYPCNIGSGMPNAPIPFNSYWIDGMHEKMQTEYGNCIP